MPNSNSAVVRPSLARRRRGLIESFKGIMGASLAYAERRGGGRARCSIVEPLEDRQLMSVVYVSASGNDKSNGSSQSSPVRTFARAKKLVGSGDQMLLKCGDSWSTAIGDWNKSNTTIGSYGGGAKPQIITGSDAIHLSTASNVTVKGISLVGTGRTSHYGIVMLGRNSNVVIDGVDVKSFRINITAQGFFGSINNLTIRNSSITDSNANGMSHGIYADKVQGLTLDNNKIERNGGRGSMFNHGAYITALCSNLVARNNVFAASSNYGLQARCGGVITGNTFANNSVGLSVGYVNGGGVHVNGGVTITVTGNTFTGVGVGLKGGIGIQAGNIKSGIISGNRFINGGGKYGAAISLERGTASGNQVGINNLVIKDNDSSGWNGRGLSISKNAGVRNITSAGNSL